MYVIVFLQGFVFYGPIATLFRQARGLSMYEIFLLESIFVILMFIFEVPWGWFADNFGYKKTLVFSHLLFFASKIIFYKANSFQLFALEAIVVALAIAGISGCDTALLYNSAGEKESEKIFGKYNAFGTAGFLTASVLSTFVIAKSMDYAAFLTIFPYGAAAVLTFFIQDASDSIRKEKNSIYKSIRNVLKNKEILLFVLALALVNEVYRSISVFLNQIKYIKVGIDVKYFGLLIALMQIINLNSTQSYKLTEKFGKGKTIKTLSFIIGMCTFLLIFVNSRIATILLIALISGSYAIIQPSAIDIQNKSITTSDRATILSIYAMGGNIIASIVNLSVGRAANVSVEAAFVVCGFLILVSLVLLYVYFKPKMFGKA